MDKLFTIAGTSTYKGENTWRFATGLMKKRVSVLTRYGHTNIALQELPQGMVKKDAIAFLSTQGISAVMPVGRKKQGTEAPVAAPVVAAPAATTAKKLTPTEAKAAKNAKRAAKRAAEKDKNKALVAGTAAPVAVAVQEVPTVDEAAAEAADALAVKNDNERIAAMLREDEFA